MTAVTLNGQSYSDDGSQSRDMRFGGHQTWLLPMLQDAMTEIEVATDAAVSADSSAAAASTSASSAANYAAALNGTSTSANDIGTGSKTWTTQAGKQFGVGGYVQVIRQSGTTMWMIGQVTAYNTGTGSITVNVEDSNGAGNFSGWDIRVAGKRGAQGLQGNDGTISVPYSGRTSAFSPVAGDKGKMFDCTSGTYSITFAAAASIGANWFCYIRNSGTGGITLDPNGAETIDGLASFVLYPGAVRLVQCDGTTLRTIPLVGGVRKFTMSGTYIVPPGVASIDVTAVGPGGGGSSGSKLVPGFPTITPAGGGGGAGGSKLARRLSNVSAGTSVSVTVPSGGAGPSGTNTASGNPFALYPVQAAYANSGSWIQAGYDGLKVLNGKILHIRSVPATHAGSVSDIQNQSTYSLTIDNPGSGAIYAESAAWNGLRYVVVGKGSSYPVIYGTTSDGAALSSTMTTRYNTGTGSGDKFLTVDYLAGSVNLFAAGDSAGNIVTSPDSVTWSTRTSNFASNYIYHITNNGTYFLAIGGGGKISKSTDGITWTAKTSGTAQALYRAVWSSTLSLWVVVGAASTVLTSPDGGTWTPRTYGGTSVDLTALFEISGTFHALSWAGTANFRTSINGTAWNTWSTNAPTNYSSSYGAPIATTYNGGMLVAHTYASSASVQLYQGTGVVYGAVGGTSGPTSFGAYVSAPAGAGGSLTSVTGASGSNGAGGGGYGATSNAVGGSGTAAYPLLTSPANGGAVGTSGGAGIVTADADCGTGGGGGGGSSSGDAGDGGAGGVPGGGGGGGGFTTASGATWSGDGGTGGRGEVLVVEVL